MVLCVTGPMAAGKNFISSQYEKKGFAIIDADKIGHKAVDECKEKILKTFGTLAEEKRLNLQNQDGTINRRNLGSLIFNNPELLKKHEEIVFPYINSELEKFIEQNESCILNAAVLYKIPIIKKVEKIIFVTAPKIIRFFRAKKRDGMKTKQILQRFKNQKNLLKYYKQTGIPIEIIKNW